MSAATLKETIEPPFRSRFHLVRGVLLQGKPSWKSRRGDCLVHLVANSTQWGNLQRGETGRKKNGDFWSQDRSTWVSASGTKIVPRQNLQSTNSHNTSKEKPTYGLPFLIENINDGQERGNSESDKLTQTRKRI